MDELMEPVDDQDRELGMAVSCTRPHWLDVHEAVVPDAHPFFHLAHP
ncbi:hypothetical protein [Streptomyces sp. NPDC093018]